MKAKIPFERRNPKGAAASKAEILRQIVETSKDYELETDALFLWTLHVSPKYRLGLGRLRELYEEFFSCEKKFMTSTVPNRKRIRNAIRVSLKMKTNR